VNEPWWAALLREQLAAGFPDLQGAEGWLRLPISDRLLTRVVLARIPASVPISDFDLIAEDGNQVMVRVRVGKPSFLPPFRVRFAIEQQPALPHSPVLVLRMMSQGIAAFAGPAMRFFQALPPEVGVIGDRIHVDIAALLGRHGVGHVLAFLSQLEVTTEQGRVIVAARGRLPHS
jgi:hypothetical protein